VKDGIAGQDEAQDPIHVSPLFCLRETTIVIGNQVILDNMSGLGIVCVCVCVGGGGGGGGERERGGGGSGQGGGEGRGRGGGR